jgi:hypothetical protein
MCCGDAVEGFGSEWFRSTLTATISTFNWSGFFENYCGPSKPKLCLIAHGSEFTGQATVLRRLHSSQERFTFLLFESRRQTVLELQNLAFEVSGWNFDQAKQLSVMCGQHHQHKKKDRDCCHGNIDQNVLGPNRRLVIQVAGSIALVDNDILHVSKVVSEFMSA